MADVQPLRALHYDLERTGGLQEVIAPPYDVIGPDHRMELERRSPFNVVRIDLPVGEDPYQNAASQLERWIEDGVVVRDDTPAIWALSQDYTGPDGEARTRTGFLARVRVDEYGPGRIRPHERTHPGPKEDRLKLTRSTRANLSPIFSLFSDPAGETRGALEPGTQQEPWATATDDDGTTNRLWRVDDQQAIATVQKALADKELLIADGHHRYETARVYADEIGGEGEHRYVLMCLVALQDPGLTVFPTHRLLTGLTPEQQEALADELRRDFTITELEVTGELAPGEGNGNSVRLGYLDSHFRRAFRLELRDQSIADAALAGHAEPYRQLDTAVLEALVLKGALGMTDDDIDHLAQLDYERSAERAVELVLAGDRDAAFLMGNPPIELIQAVAGAGETMPPKSTYFFPKVPTGLVFNPL